jgi:hypothetical protein
MEDERGVNRTYLVPANSKKSTLIFSLFRPIDLLIFGIGTVITFVLLMILPLQNYGEQLLLYFHYKLLDF